jgi:hypothetical protein
MRSVLTGALLLLLTVPATYADDGPFEPPERRIRPPTGVTAQAEPPSLAETLWAWLKARIGPPGG